MKLGEELPFTCHGCHEVFFVAAAELAKDEPINCPNCSLTFRLKPEQMKHLPRGRKPVRE